MERTALAWSRTALALLVNAALFLRTALEAHSQVMFAAGMLLLAMAGLTAGQGFWRRRILGQRAGPAVAPAGALAALAWAIVVCSAGVLGCLSQAHG
jgi:uncharacterized membrane protein YidH (DUF202 family)